LYETTESGFLSKYRVSSIFVVIVIPDPLYLFIACIFRVSCIISQKHTEYMLL